jgi:hypothetical protein
VADDIVPAARARAKFGAGVRAFVLVWRFTCCECIEYVKSCAL